MMEAMTRRSLVACMGVLLAGCGSAGNHEPEKRYPMQGVVKSVDPAGKTATIAAGKIPGWMDAMTMEFPVKPDAELAQLHPGDRIEGTVVVDDLKYYVTGLKVLPKQ